MKKVILVFFIFTVSLLTAQNVIVLDFSTHQPLGDVVVTSLSPSKTTITNSNGEVDIYPFIHSTKIEVRLLGYETIITTYDKIKRDNYQIFLHQLQFNLDEVVVSATRWRQSSSRIPEKILHINNADIELLNPQTTADILQISGKVFVQKSQLGGGSPMIRGFATNRLLYSVDGIRMNTAIFRAGNLQNIISLDPLTLENSEILFGSSSVIYGSDAIGGVMSFSTLSPQFALTTEKIIEGNVLTRYATANQEKTIHFDANIGCESWAFRTSVSRFDFDDLKQGSHGLADYVKKYNVKVGENGNDIVTLNHDKRLQSPSGYSQFNAMQKIAFRPNRNWNFTLAIHYSQLSPYGRYDRHLRMKKGFPKYAEWNYGSQIWNMNNFEITHSKPNLLYDQFIARLAYQRFEESRIVRKLNAIQRETNTEKVDAFSTNFDFKKTVAQKHTLFYGFEWVRNRVHSLGRGENITSDSIWNITTRYPQSNWYSTAFYSQMQFRLNRSWTLQSGLRYNQFLIDGTFDATTQQEYQFPFDKLNLKDEAFTGNLGVVYRLDNRLMLSSNLSTGFRSPNVDDLGKIFDSASGIVVVPNPELKAEYATNIDVNLAKVFGDRMKVDITGFCTFLDDAIVRSDYLLNGQDSIAYKGTMSRVQALQNSASGMVFGIQLGGEIKIFPHLIFTTDLNWQKGIEKTEEGSIFPLRHSAPLFGNVRLNYKYQKLTLRLYADYQAKVNYSDMPNSEKKKKEIYALDINGNVYSPSWYTLNLKSNYKFSKNILCSAGIENITDRRYRPYSSGISGAGRNLMIAVKITW